MRISAWNRFRESRLLAIASIMAVMSVGLVQAGAQASGVPDGTLDPSFGSGGKVTTSFGSYHDYAGGVAVQSDGKIVAAGSSYTDAASTAGTFALARYNTDGTLDTTFSGDGKVTTAFTGLSEVWAVAIQPDGKIVAVGEANAVWSDYECGASCTFALARYNPNGTLDTTFGTLVAPGVRDGKVTTSMGGPAWAAVLQPDGKIVVAGGSEVAGTFALARYNPNGTLDTTFDGDGKVTTPFFGPFFGPAWAVALQPDGKIVASGGTGAFALARYNANGTLDTTFSGDGRVTTSSTGPAYSVKVQPDGKIVAAGGWSTFDLARYNANGTLDTTFDGDGRVATSFGGCCSEAYAAAIRSDGRIVVAGTFYPGVFGGAGQVVALARYNTNGALDTTFDGDGRVTTAFAPGAAYAYAVALQADGGIVVAGEAWSTTDGGFALARYLVDTTPPETTIDSGTNGTVGSTSATFSFSSEPGATFECQLDADPYGACTSPVELTGLTEGAHTFSVRAIDEVGNTDPTPAGLAWTIETGTVDTYAYAGDPVATGTEATLEAPVQTTLTTTQDGPVTITLAPGGGEPPAGFQFLGQQVEIVAPAGTAESPLQLVFLIDAALAPEQNESTIAIFRDGEPVGNCTATSPAIEPVPCVSNRAVVGDDYEITVLTDHASVWNTGFAWTYAFDGFFAPVDNLPTLNAARGGSAIPVKFSLDGDQGLDIFATGFPKSGTTDCGTDADIDLIETTVTAGSSSLDYNETTDTYSYVWKTDKAWAGTCRQLVLMLSDGTVHRADFAF